MKQRIIATALFALFAFSFNNPVQAQAPATVKLCNGGQPNCPVINSGNPLPVTGTFSASLGGFVPSLSYTTLTATASSSASTALPTNTGTVAFQNQTTAPVSCTLASGAATATTNEIIVPAGSTIFVGTTGYDHAACINQTGSASNVIVLAGGSGLGTGFGGGGGGSSGGAVTLASGAAVLGSLVDINNGTNTPWPGTGTTSLLGGVFGVYNQLVALNTAAALPVPFKAQSSEPAAATTGNPVASFGDLAGKLVTSPYANRENQVRGTASTNAGTATTLLAAGGSGLKTYAWASCGRTDAGTAAITVTFNDVEGTGSGTIMVLPNNGGGGGNNQTDPIPMVTAANTALTFTASTATTSVICNARGFTGY